MAGRAGTGQGDDRSGVAWPRAPWPGVSWDNISEGSTSGHSHDRLATIADARRQGRHADDRYDPHGSVHRPCQHDRSLDDDLHGCGLAGRGRGPAHAVATCSAQPARCLDARVGADIRILPAAPHAGSAFGRGREQPGSRTPRSGLLLTATGSQGAVDWPGIGHVGSWPPATRCRPDSWDMATPRVAAGLPCRAGVRRGTGGRDGIAGRWPMADGRPNGARWTCPVGRPAGVTMTAAVATCHRCVPRCPTSASVRPCTVTARSGQR
jgi:hypothetical protein